MLSGTAADYDIQTDWFAFPLFFLPFPFSFSFPEYRPWSLQARN